MDQPNASGSWMARAVTVSFLKRYLRVHTLASSGLGTITPLPLLLFFRNYFRASNKLLGPDGRGSMQLDGFYNFLSLRVWLGGAHFCWEATKRPQLGEAAAPLPPPFLAWRLKIGVSASPFSVPSPGTGVGPLAHSEQGKGLLSETCSVCDTHVELVASLVKAGPGPGRDSTLEVPQENRRKEKPTK